MGSWGRRTRLELPFVWDLIDEPTWLAFVGEDPPRALVTAMQDAWLAFARTGDPNVAGAVPWPRYDLATRPTLELGEVVRLVNDPSKERRELWYRAAETT